MRDRAETGKATGEGKKGRRGRGEGKRYLSGQLVKLHLVGVAAGKRCIAGACPAAGIVGELGTETSRRVERVAAVAACRIER
jgi:hypothetical protein